MLRIRLVLVGIEGKINMGFIVRLAENFGVEDICVVSPEFSIDDPEVREFAAGGVKALSRVRVVDSLSDCLSGVSLSICTTAKTSSEDILRISVPSDMVKYVLPESGVVALVFGRESVGLTREELSKCDVVSTINTGTEYPTMNLSHAVAIYLYELANVGSRRLTTGDYCPRNVMDAMYREISLFCADLADERACLALKRALARARLSKSECGALYKLFKKIRHRLSECTQLVSAND